MQNKHKRCWLDQKTTYSQSRLAYNSNSESAKRDRTLLTKIKSKAPVSQLVNAEVNSGSRKAQEGGGGGGGYSGFQVTRMIEWGQK